MSGSEEKPQDPSMGFYGSKCPNCGELIPNGQRFCAYCGFRKGRWTSYWTLLLAVLGMPSAVVSGCCLIGLQGAHFPNQDLSVGLTYLFGSYATVLFFVVVFGWAWHANRSKGSPRLNRAVFWLLGVPALIESVGWLWVVFRASRAMHGSLQEFAEGSIPGLAALA